jgi:hypothetical protein
MGGGAWKPRSRGGKAGLPIWSVASLANVQDGLKSG